MNRSKLRLSLQSLLLLALLPALALLIVTYAAHSYTGLRDIIIRGFEHKLLAISSTTASFIDPSDHLKLMEPLASGALALDPADGSLWSFDRRTVHGEFFEVESTDSSIRDADRTAGVLLKIRPTDGLATPSPLRLPVGFNNIAAGIEPGELFVLNGTTGEVLSLSTLTGATQKVLNLEPPLTGFATDRAHRHLYASGRHLDRVDLRTGQVQRLGDLRIRCRDLACDETHQRLWTLSPRGDTLLELDLTNGAVRHSTKLMTEKPATAPETWQPEPVTLNALIYDPASNRLLATSRSLVAVNPETGVVSAKGFLSAFGREIGPAYLRYAAPMRRITHRTNITFLYTQLVTDHNRITYGIDGTVGENHSPLLSLDTVPETEVPLIQRVFTARQSQVTDMKVWDKWGLLKSAFTPILDTLGVPIAMAGADVDVSTVRFETRRALVVTFSVGAILLVIGGLLTLAIARQINRPLFRIKSAALQVAAGDYQQTVEIGQPREFHELARAFNDATLDLGRNFQHLRETLSKGRAARDRRALTRRLAAEPILRLPPAGLPWAWGAIGATGPTAPIPGGATTHGAHALVWCHRPPADPLAAAARRAEIGLTAAALMARHHGEPAALAAALAGLFAAEVDLWGLLTPSGAHVITRRPGLVHRVPVGAVPIPVAELDFSAPFRPPPGEALLLASAGAPLSKLPALAGADQAAALLAAWHDATSGETPAAYAVVYYPTA